MIAGRLAGRTDNEIKNYWNTHLRKKLLSKGIDPATHMPLNQPPSSSSATTAQEETCPDLNLELSISPPHDHPPQPFSCTTTTATV